MPIEMQLAIHTYDICSEKEISKFVNCNLNRGHKIRSQTYEIAWEILLEQFF